MIIIQVYRYLKLLKQFFTDSTAPMAEMPCKAHQEQPGV